MERYQLPTALTDKDVREKLAARGPAALDNAELLSVLLRDGTNGVQAIDTAMRILSAHGESISTLASSGLHQLRQLEGIGISRAATLAAAFELGRRVSAEEHDEPEVVNTSDDVEKIFSPMLSRLKHEEMWALYLTTANKVIEKQRVGQGGVTSLVTDYRLIVKRAIELLASSIILIHNHPSGTAAPSPEDIEMTNRTSSAAELFDIVLVDHIIIAGSSTYSFRRNSLIK